MRSPAVTSHHHATTAAADTKLGPWGILNQNTCAQSKYNYVEYQVCKCSAAAS